MTRYDGSLENSGYRVRPNNCHATTVLRSTCELLRLRHKQGPVKGKQLTVQQLDDDIRE